MSTRLIHGLYTEEALHGAFRKAHIRHHAPIVTRIHGQKMFQSQMAELFTCIFSVKNIHQPVFHPNKTHINRNSHHSRGKHFAQRVDLSCVGAGIGFQGNTQDLMITLEYLHFLRPEQTFPSLEALTGQLNRDKAAARQWAAEYPSLPEECLRPERS